MDALVREEWQEVFKDPSWKSKPQVFHNMKIEYAMLIGFLHGIAYARQNDVTYEEMYDLLIEHLQERRGDIINCGEGCTSPSLSFIVEDAADFLDSIAPLRMEREITVIEGREDA